MLLLWKKHVNYPRADGREAQGSMLKAQAVGIQYRCRQLLLEAATIQQDNGFQAPSSVSVALQTPEHWRNTCPMQLPPFPRCLSTVYAALML